MEIVFVALGLLALIDAFRSLKKEMTLMREQIEALTATADKAVVAMEEATAELKAFKTVVADLTAQLKAATAAGDGAAIDAAVAKLEAAVAPLVAEETPAVAPVVEAAPVVETSETPAPAEPTAPEAPSTTGEPDTL